MMSFITIGRHQICITYKKMKTIRLAFNATTGELKVSAPAGMSEALLKQFLQHRQSWIDKHVAMFEAQVKPHANRYVSGEQHYLEGKAYELQVIENASINRIIIEADGIIMLFVVHGFTAKQRETLIYALYRVRLIQRVTPLIEKWQNIMNVKATKWGVKRMKSRWGSCNTKTGSIWVSLELAKKAAHLLEYLIVHELAHLLEASHNNVFKAYMDRFLPDWKLRKAELNERASLPGRNNST